MTGSTSRPRLASAVAMVGLLVGTLAATAAPAAAAGLVVNSLADSAVAGDGSCTLREAVHNANDDGDGTSGDCAAGGGADTITFSVSGTITLASGALTLSDNVTIAASPSPGVVVSGGDADRVFVVNAGVNATIRSLTLSDGYGWQLGGAIVDNGALTLDRVVVTDNRMATNAGDYWQGGGGIYVGEGGALSLLESTVSGNQAAWAGGGIYAFFGSTTTIVRSTISGNVSNDVGGAIRSLGNVSVINSTISGNQANGWHGGAIFHTDAAMTISSSTIVGNTGPAWAPSAIFIGSFGGPAPSLELQNTLITGNQWYACDHWTGPSTLTSGGYNIVQDETCSPASTDVINEAATPEALADNGGPTLTMAVPAGSPAVDAIPVGTNGCGTTLTTDQRGWIRPVGMPCDVGAFELGAEPPFTFTGFFAPVDNPPILNSVQAGAAVPVRFGLGGDQGLDVFADGSPTSVVIACTSGASADPIEQTTSAGSSSLSYDPSTDSYTYVWKTQKAWRDSCRQLTVTLDDGSTHIATFQFR